MLEEIKKELLYNPPKIESVLEHFGYTNIAIHDKYMQFGRDIYSSKKSISIHFENNDYLYVKDWSRNINKDLISYICTQRNVSFSDVMDVIKSVLGISDFYDYFDTGKGIFGGIYDKVRKNKESKVNTYNNSILQQYPNHGNLRFLKDNISLQSQRFFEIKYDIESQSIVIPIRNQLGQLVGVKARCNYDVPDGEQKYYYLVPCSMSRVLYGYSQNYQYLQGNTVYIFEAEKSPMQCFSYGIRNAVALGSGSLSSKQAQMIMELNPEKVIFMHDVGFSYENIERNMKSLRNYSRFSELEIGYWDFFDRGYEDKVSASDLGESECKRILREEIKYM